MIDDGEDVQIMRVIMADLPPALTTDMIRQAVREDSAYQDLKESIRSGISPYMSVWVDRAGSYQGFGGTRGEDCDTRRQGGRGSDHTQGVGG